MSKKNKSGDPRKRSMKTDNRNSVKIDNYVFNDVNENNVRGFCNMLNKISLVSGSCFYDERKTPISNLIQLNKIGGGTTWETHGDWEDFLNGVFDQYLTETERQHINNIINQMLIKDIDTGMSIHDGNNFYFQKTKQSVLVEKNNRYFDCINLYC